MISEKRYLSVKQLFKELGFDNLTEDEIELYGDMFEIIAQLTHNKLTDKEMITAYDILVDTADGRNLKFAVDVPKVDRIKVQLRLMEELPETAGKLTLDEKVNFAFCVYYSYFIERYDKERNSFFKCLIDFTSVDRIVNELEHAKKTHPDLFDFKTPTQKKEETKKPTHSKEEIEAIIAQINKDMKDTEDYGDAFGYSKRNPILATSVSASYGYINSLKYPNAKLLQYRRVGSLDDENGNTLDKYILRVTHSDNSIKEYGIYINPYSLSTSTDAPEGFILASAGASNNNVSNTTSNTSKQSKVSKFLGKIFGK